jgi:hypothetical protein
MFIVFKEDYQRYLKTYQKGTKIYVSEKFAKILIGKGIAEQFKEPKKKAVKKPKK